MIESIVKFCALLTFIAYIIEGGHSGWWIVLAIFLAGAV